jgi:integrase
MLRAAAPETDWSAHRRIMSRIWRAVAEHRSPRKDGRIVSSVVLFEAAQARSLERGQGLAPPDLASATARRDAAMVAFLAVLPIRRRAFVELEIGRSFLRTEAGLSVVLDSAMTKTRQHWEAAVPPVLMDIMTDYLEHVRPVMTARARPPSPALWLNDHGRPYGGIHLAARIREITEDYVGVRVSPHFFRDCAATTLAYASPEHAWLTRPVLGHSSFRTGERHYNQAKGIEAGRRYAEVIARFQWGSS